MDRAGFAGRLGAAVLSLLELSCLGIVALYVAGRGYKDGFDSWPLQFAGIAAAAWMGEQTCIAAYDFYHYAGSWALRAGAVPVTVALIWPVVILSAEDVAARVVGGEQRGKIAALTFGMVLLDAALIEPVAVAAGLWAWTEVGVFGVPIIGIIGWAVFAGLWVLRRGDSWPQRALITVAGMHLCLMALWWGAFRWLRADLTAESAWPLLGVVAVAMAGLSAVVVRRRIELTIDVQRAMLRVPGALFFGLLLVVIDAPISLWAWVGVLATPWLVAVAVARTHSHLER